MVENETVEYERITSHAEFQKIQSYFYQNLDLMDSQRQELNKMGLVSDQIATVLAPLDMANYSYMLSLLFYQPDGGQDFIDFLIEAKNLKHQLSIKSDFPRQIIVKDLQVECLNCHSRGQFGFSGYPLSLQDLTAAVEDWNTSAKSNPGALMTGACDEWLWEHS